MFNQSPLRVPTYRFNVRHLTLRVVAPQAGSPGSLQNRAVFGFCLVLVNKDDARFQSLTAAVYDIPLFLMKRIALHDYD